MLCAADGTIVLFNYKAEDPIASHSKNGICGFMSTSDAVRYDIVMNSTKPRSFRTAVVAHVGYRYMDIIPMDMGDMRVCVAVFHKTVGDGNCVCELSSSDLREFIKDMAGCEILRKYSSPEYPVLDLADATQKIYCDLLQRGVCDLEGDFSDFNASQDVIPGEMGLQNYIYLMTAALSALNDIAGRKRVKFGIEGSHGCYRINMTVKMDNFVFGFGPSASETISASSRAKLELCELVAHNNDLRFEVEFNGDELRMVLSDLTVTLDHDFKSHYRYLGYEDMLERALYVMSTVAA